ncbi:MULTISPECIES: enoyl-ACP reductase FabI [Corallococcus]|uniref:Enoyl-[acyl-carrier-protein] reductase [NADH] n=2 Tax=Corallococcus TaxID=83461 RepID=A0A3A8I9N5_9BACT|nr:enoyl-ACP reductase FabI [Corallococcus exercitus]NOK33489.1 enoyl-ACP reductase FabI [Corallococcus exercitus]RKG79785.1 enoyl-[acyl-carrier-protein] reductase FabI [Corallococcus exercitus]GMU09437.1 enoyl-ACP reductase FabI [Corallococcus sp. NO1]
MLLQGKKLLITGVLTPQSLAFGVAEHAIAQGAEVILTGFGRAKSLTERSAKRLKPGTEVLELDVTNPAHFPALTEALRQKWGRVDGVLHAIAYAPEDALGGNFLNTPWESVQTAFRVSAFSVKELAVACAPLMPPGGSIVALDFDNRQAWPIYDWMGVCKAAMEATVRYLARDLGPKGIRVNALAAGPLATVAAKGIPGFKALAQYWGKQAPLGWSDKDSHDHVAKTACALLSDWLSSTTGEMIHVDGGYHAVGAPPVETVETPAEGVPANPTPKDG